MQPKILFAGVFLFFKVSLFAQLTFVIESIPTATPAEDSIFIVGNFNHWQIGNPDWCFKQRLDGHFQFSMPIPQEPIEFKFSRGDWMQVETDEKNKFLNNRVWSPGDDALIRVGISNWQDLGGVKQSDLSLFFFVGTAIFGVSLLLFVISVNNGWNRSLNLFVGANVFVLLAIIVGACDIKCVFQGKVFLQMLLHLLFFSWGAALLFFLRANFQAGKVKVHRGMFLVIPLVTLVAVSRISNWSFFEDFAWSINRSLSFGGTVLIFLGLIVNGIYHVIGYLWLTRMQEQVDEERFYQVKWVFQGSFLVLVALLVNWVLLFMGIGYYWLDNFEMVYFVLSIIVIVEFVYVLRHHDFLKNRQRNKGCPDADRLVAKLEVLMVKDKTFKNPDLNLADLSLLMDTKPYVLSRLLNENFNKSFRDFINEYRVEAFIELVKADQEKKFTYIAIAHEVGFNSKSTFNLAFKKVTGFSPREFFKAVEV